MPQSKPFNWIKFMLLINTFMMLMIIKMTTLPIIKNKYLKKKQFILISMMKW